MSIPKFDKNGNLPEGTHPATWQEVEEALAFNERRQEGRDLFLIKNYEDKPLA